MEYFKNLCNPKDCIAQSTSEVRNLDFFIKNSLVYPRLAIKDGEQALVWVAYVDKKPGAFHTVFIDQPVFEGTVMLIGDNAENDMFDGYVFEHHGVPHQIILDEFCGHKIMEIKMLQNEKEVRYIVDSLYDLKDYEVFVTKLGIIPTWYMTNKNKALLLPIFYKDLGSLTQALTNPDETIISYEQKEIIQNKKKRYEVNYSVIDNSIELIKLSE